MDNYSIPPIVHYCWFGKKEKPDSIKKYIQGWKRLLPEFQFIEWNEDNFPINYNRYTMEAYEHKKYAFVSDVARLYALKKFGGFYFDTDIELKQSLKRFCDKKNAIFAFESEKQLMTGFFAAPKNHTIIEQFLNSYQSVPFVNEDGSLDETPNTDRITNILLGKGLKLGIGFQNLECGVEIFPTEIFGAYDVDNSCFVDNEETVLIHHCVSSWMPLSYKLKDRLKRFVAAVIGRNHVKKIRNFRRK